MKVERDRVVRFHYDLSGEHGEAIESSRKGDAVAVLIGHRNVIPGVEAALSGKELGDRFQTTVPPALGYGLRQEHLKERLSKKHIVGKHKLKAGDPVTIRTRSGLRDAIVSKVGSKVIDVDLHHPMAGRTLVFDIEVVDVREAAPEELAHGHVHGMGGNHH